MGLLLPCNVTVYEEDDRVIVAAIDPQLMLSVLKDERALPDVADEAKAKLTRVIESLKS